MNLELRHIRCFCAVAEELHFTRAAKRLNVAQPALSRSIAQVEEIVGVPLFNRTNRHVSLTPAGNAFYDSCGEIENSVNRSIVQAQKAGAGNKGRLVVGYTDFAITGPLPQILKQFRLTFPDVEVETVHGFTVTQLEKLESNTLDVGFITGPMNKQGYSTQTVQSDKLMVMLYENHPLADQQEIQLESLCDEKFIMGTDYGWRHYLDHLYGIFRRHGFSPNVVQQAYNSEGIFGLVACEMGITVYPECARNYHRAGVVMRKLAGTNRTIPTQAIWRDSDMLPVARVFTEFLKDFDFS